MFLSRFLTWKHTPFTLPLLFLVLLLTSIPASARAATKMLMINPVRVIFTDRQRSINVHAINSSNEPITYTISLVTMRKNKNGKLYKPEIETEEEQMIKKMIRFSPRRATIAPGERQIVKLMVRKPADLPTGEYQTRLRLSPQPNTSGVASNLNRTDTTGRTINLDIIVDSTFPIIIQHGGLTSEVTPQAISVKDFPTAPAGIAAEVNFSRSGGYSAFGNVFLTFTPTDNSKASREIGRSLGLAIYQPDTQKNITVLLTGISRDELSTGTITVTFQPDTGVVNKRKQKKAQRRSRDFTLP